MMRGRLKLLDAEKLLSVLRSRVLTEANLSVPTCKSDYKKLAKAQDLTFHGAVASIYMRSKDEAAVGKSEGRGKHGCSVKVSTQFGEFSIAIPSGQMDLQRKSVNDIDVFHSSVKDRNLRSSVMSLIYDNQVAILALWNAVGQDDLRRAIRGYIKAQIISSDYLKQPIKSCKTEDELESDKDELVAYIQSTVGHDVKLSFDSKP